MRKVVKLFFVRFITFKYVVMGDGFFSFLFLGPVPCHFLADRSKVGDPSASTTTNQHNEKKTTTSLDASHCRCPLRSKQHKEVKLEQWEEGGNMHNKTPVADSPYCRSQNPGLPASSPSCQPVRVKLEKPDNLFCAAEKVKGRETNNVKLDTGDLEGNLVAASYKGKCMTFHFFTVISHG